VFTSIYVYICICICIYTCAYFTNANIYFTNANQYLTNANKYFDSFESSQRIVCTLL